MLNKGLSMWLCLLVHNHTHATTYAITSISSLLVYSTRVHTTRNKKRMGYLAHSITPSLMDVISGTIVPDSIPLGIVPV
jgi:hypothetical protein